MNLLDRIDRMTWIFLLGVFRTPSKNRLILLTLSDNFFSPN
jgi:hypothetical protein